MDKNQKGFGHLLLFVIVIMVVAAIGFVGYKVGTSKNKQPQAVQNSEKTATGGVLEKGSSGCTPDAPVAEAKDAFTESPFNIDQIKVVTLGKETNDPRFLYPWVKKDKAEIFAPATGKLYLIRHKVYEVNGEKGNDYDMFFAVDCKTVYRFNHISNPRSDIKEAYPAGDLPSGDYADGGQDIAERVKPKTAIVVKAGESLGYTTGTPGAHSFDFAAGVSKGREDDKLATCPFKLFKEPLQSKLLALLGPKTNYTPQAGYACEIEAKKF